MAKQISLYATPADLTEMEQKLREKTGFAVIGDRSETASPEFVDFLLPREGMIGTHLWVCLAKPEDLGNIVFRHVPSQSYWAVDVMRSPVVEFRRCFCNGTILRQGRLFMETGYFNEENQRLEKPQAFQEWAAIVFQVTKKLFKRDPLLNAYVGSHAESWRQQTGGTFVGN